jgi:hypothetical protein
MLGGHTGLNSTHAKSCSLNLDRAVVALSFCLLLVHTAFVCTIAHSNNIRNQFRTLPLQPEALSQTFQKLAIKRHMVPRNPLRLAKRGSPANLPRPTREPISKVTRVVLPILSNTAISLILP